MIRELKPRERWGELTAEMEDSFLNTFSGT